jgi:hypothetical protein
LDLGITGRVRMALCSTAVPASATAAASRLGAEIGAGSEWALAGGRTDPSGLLITTGDTKGGGLPGGGLDGSAPAEDGCLARRVTGLLGVRAALGVVAGFSAKSAEGCGAACGGERGASA